MKKITIYCRPENGGDGSARIKWYLTQADAETAYEAEDEAFSEDGIEAVETFEGSNVHKEAVENSAEVNDEYFYLKGNYYETREVAKGRKEKQCAQCGRTIKIGEPAHTHKFYPEFEGYDTHPGKCSDDFIDRTI